MNTDSRIKEGSEISDIGVRNLKEREEGMGGAMAGTVLIAEDHELVRNLFKRTLERHGFKTVLAADGEEAVEQFRRYQDEVDLLLLDIAMPKKSGKQAFEEIRQAVPDIKVIFVSGCSEDNECVKSILKEGHMFLPKPVTGKDLVGVIQSVLR